MVYYMQIHDCEEAHFRTEDRFAASKRSSARITTLRTCKGNKENITYMPGNYNLCALID